MKKLLLVIIMLFVSISAINVKNVKVEASQIERNMSKVEKLQSNQAYLYYIYSNETGHYFLEPTAEYENVIYIGKDDYKVDSNYYIDTDNLHHGKKYIGTFYGDDKWELKKIEEVK